MIAWLSKITGHDKKISDELSRIYSLRPNDKDIALLRQLVTRGVNQNDIESLLNITAIEFEAWKSIIEVDRIIKLKAKQDPEKFTLNHTSLLGQTEFAFESGLIKFYRFKEEYRHPIGRYKYVYKRFKEADMRISLPAIKTYLSQMKEVLEGGPKKNSISVGAAWKILYAMETWLTIPFEPEAVRRLAEVVYFTEDEDLSTFDESEGKRKNDLWRKNNTHDFFLTRPIGELLNLSNSSITSLEEYFKEVTPIMEALNSDLYPKSSENT